MARKRMADGSFLSHDMEAKHASLMQDYHLLQHEFEALKDRLQAARMTKATLLAEVRFLRRRLKKLKETPSDKENGRASSAYLQHQSLQTHNAKNHSQSLMPPPSTNSTKTNPFPVIWKPFSDESVKKNSVRDHSGLVGVLKPKSLRNRSSAFATGEAEKRKISWQDQISLECN